MRPVIVTGKSVEKRPLIEINSTSKPGGYQRSQLDLSAILNGQQVDLVRVYDSLQRGVPGAFGFGWALAGWNSAIQTDVLPTGREAQGLYNPLRIGSRLYVTLPDGAGVQ